MSDSANFAKKAYERLRVPFICLISRAYTNKKWATA